MGQPWGCRFCAGTEPNLAVQSPGVHKFFRWRGIAGIADNLNWLRWIPTLGRGTWTHLCRRVPGPRSWWWISPVSMGCHKNRGISGGIFEAKKHLILMVFILIWMSDFCDHKDILFCRDPISVIIWRACNVPLSFPRDMQSHGGGNCWREAGRSQSFDASQQFLLGFLKDPLTVPRNSRPAWQDLLIKAYLSHYQRHHLKMSCQLSRSNVIQSLTSFS